MNISLNHMAAMLPPDFKHLLHISCGEGEMIRGLAKRHDALFTTDSVNISNRQKQLVIIPFRCPFCLGY
jgi:cyclopropane fatty-acyl-phospholipid synthase-like methyltransferase